VIGASTDLANMTGIISAIPVTWRGAGLAALSGLLLAIPYNDSGLFPFAWIALVPLLIAVEGANVRTSYLLGLVAGLSFYTVAAPWIVDFVMLFKGFDQGRSFAISLLFWLYCAQLPALLFASFAALRRWTGISDVILFPVLTVAFYAGFPMLFSVQLGESQSAFLAGIQAVAITGVYGLDFAIALANVVLFRGLLFWWKRRRTPRLQVLTALAMLALWFGFGIWSVGHWDKLTANWPTARVGLLQPGDPPLLGSAPVYPGFSRAYPPEMEMSARLAEAGAKLIVWPEGPYKHFLDDPRVGDAFRREAAALGVDILAQDIETVDGRTRYNSVVMLQASGTQSPPYRKMKRVAFGEALPLAGAVPSLDAFLQEYLGQFFRGIQAGRERQIFNSAGLTIAPLICYEALFPVFTARGLTDAGKGAILVTVSSNGWFGDSRQPYQHANASILRAVENRVPFLHVINDGPSLAVLPNGRRVFSAPRGEPGGYLLELPHSEHSGGSFFTHFPAWFIGGIYASLSAFCLLALWAGLRSSRAGRALS
jgi:apolipoprotein N-acyltransferase